MFWISWSSSSLCTFEYVNLTLNPNSNKRLSTVPRTLTPSKVAISTTERHLPIRKSSWSLGIEYLGGRPRCPVKAVAGDETPKISWFAIRQSRAPLIRFTICSSIPYKWTRRAIKPCSQSSLKCKASTVFGSRPPPLISRIILSKSSRKKYLNAITLSAILDQHGILPRPGVSCLLVTRPSREKLLQKIECIRKLELLAKNTPEERIGDVKYSKLVGKSKSSPKPDTTRKFKSTESSGYPKIWLEKNFWILSENW